MEFNTIDHVMIMQVGRFLPQGTMDALKNTQMKDLIVSLLHSAKQLSNLQDLETNPVIEVVKMVLQAILDDGCAYVSPFR